jgi:hypothetical protein
MMVRAGFATIDSRIFKLLPSRPCMEKVPLHPKIRDLAQDSKTVGSNKKQTERPDTDVSVPRDCDRPEPTSRLKPS